MPANAFFRAFQAWQHDGTDIVVVGGPSEGTLDTVRRHLDADINAHGSPISSAPVRVCNRRQNGWEFDYARPLAKPPARIIEVFTTSKSALYVATYSMPIDQPVDPAAKAALLSLCS
jgi:hypothetical protein